MRDLIHMLFLIYYLNLSLCCSTISLASQFIIWLFWQTSVSNDHNDSSENVAQKMNLRPFKLYHVFGPSQFVKCRRFFLELNWERKIRCRMFTSSIERPIGRFHVVFVQWTSKKAITRFVESMSLAYWRFYSIFNFTTQLVNKYEFKLLLKN